MVIHVVSCFQCVKCYPKQALTIQGKYYAVSNVLKEVLRDEVFYEESGGGITLSDGEVLQYANLLIFLICFKK